MRGVAIFVAALTIAACTDETEKLVHSFCRRFADQIIEHLVECAAVPPDDARRMIDPDVPRCEALGSADSLRFDAEQGEVCIASVSRMSCREYFGTPDFTKCASVFIGSTAIGESCTLAPECEPGAICSLYFGSADACMGSCVRIGSSREGEPCYFPLDCAAELECSSYTDGRCVVPRAVGDACGRDDVCVEGARCRDALCVRPPVEGEACTDFCAYPLFCEQDVCTFPHKIGEPCEARPFEFVCIVGECGPSGVCELSEPASEQQSSCLGS